MRYLTKSEVLDLHRRIISNREVLQVFGTMAR